MDERSQRGATGRVAEEAKAGLHRADEFQRRRRWAAVAVAVARKFSEDKSTNLASMIAFWAFFSVFPLLLVFVTLLGYLVPADLKNNVLTNVALMLPLLNPATAHSLGGTWWALVLGLVTALWGGLSVVNTVQFAFNSVWEIPVVRRPSFLVRMGRGVAVLATVGLGLVLSTLLTGFVSGVATGIHLGVIGRVVGFAIAIAVDVGLFLVAFRLLTHRDVSARTMLPGAVLSGVTFWILQSLSSVIISRYLHNAQSTYGSFATVITILWWFYLQSIVTLLGAQLNVVLHRGLYPRGLTGGPDTPADHRTYGDYAKERTYQPQERVDVDFQDSESDQSPGGQR